MTYAEQLRAETIARRSRMGMAYIPPIPVVKWLKPVKPANPPPAPPPVVVKRTPNDCPEIRSICEVVSREAGVGRHEIISPRRNVQVTKARFVSCYLAFKFTQASFVQIGKWHGNRDHTTIMSAVRKVSNSRQKFEPLLSICYDKLVQQGFSP